MTPLRLAFLNLTRRKVPSLIALLAIAISVACSGILLRLNLVSENRFSTIAHGGDAIVGAKAGGIDILLGALNSEGEYPGFLPYKLFESLRSEQSIRFEDGAQSKPNYLRAVIPFVYFGESEKFRVVGTDESFINRPDVEDNLHFVTGHWAAQTGEVVLGSTVAEQEHLHLGDTVPANVWTGKLGPSLQLKVAGILETTGSAWDRMLFSNLTTAHEALARVDLRELSIWGPNVLHYFLIYLQPGGFEPLSSLVNRRTVGEAVRVQHERNRLQELAGTGTKLGLFVTVLILLLGGLAMTAMLMTRFEAMASQLAVLRALGFKKNVIGRWLLWEGFLLGFGACVLGIVLDLAGFPLLRNSLGSALPSPEIIASSIFQSFPVWITTILATTASVFIPLYRVYHQDVHFSLRA